MLVGGVLVFCGEVDVRVILYVRVNSFGGVC